MVDIYSKDKRSLIMSRVKGTNTKPEVQIRKILHKLGYRFRLRSTKLPGKPDIMLPKYKKVILVNGCFWHGHEDCKRAKLPSSNRLFWMKKIEKNRLRDKRVINELRLLGWNTLTIWQCKMKNIDEIVDSIERFLQVRENNASEK